MRYKLIMNSTTNNNDPLGEVYNEKYETTELKRLLNEARSVFSNANSTPIDELKEQVKGVEKTITLMK